MIELKIFSEIQKQAEVQFVQKQGKPSTQPHSAQLGKKQECTSVSSLIEQSPVALKVFLVFSLFLEQHVHMDEKHWHVQQNTSRYIYRYTHNIYIYYVCMYIYNILLYIYNYICNINTHTYINVHLFSPLYITYGNQTNLFRQSRDEFIAARQKMHTDKITLVNF